MLVLEVKPWGVEVDLDELAQKIMAEVKKESLTWIPEYKKEPVAFGVFKLVIGCRFEDAKIPDTQEDIVDVIEQMDDFV